MSKQQTAVQWLICRLLEGIPLTLSLSNEAEQMGKEQIEDAFDIGYEASEFGNLLNKGKQYYQQTYGGDHE
jgi:hypothetical protein